MRRIVETPVICFEDGRIKVKGCGPGGMEGIIRVVSGSNLNILVVRKVQSPAPH